MIPTCGLFGSLNFGGITKISIKYANVLVKCVNIVLSIVSIKGGGGAGKCNKCLSSVWPSVLVYVRFLRMDLIIPYCTI